MVLSRKKWFLLIWNIMFHDCAMNICIANMGLIFNNVRISFKYLTTIRRPWCLKFRKIVVHKKILLKNCHYYVLLSSSNLWTKMGFLLTVSFMNGMQIIIVGNIIRTVSKNKNPRVCSSSYLDHWNESKNKFKNAYK